MKKLKSIHSAIKTTDGAGVKLNRVFGYHEVPKFDPFLMLDYFSTTDPNDVKKGFPWHPHRGIETITYILRGSVEHQDSLGNKGVIGNGDVQWMTAGSGIIHQEMPSDLQDGIEGFQLWLNLPSQDKMIEPEYGDIKADMIKKIDDGNISVKVIGGEYGGIKGPILRENLKVKLLDITLDAGNSYTHEVGEGINTFIFVYRGFGYFGSNLDRVNVKDAVLFEGTGGIRIEAGDNLGFILGEGIPLNEPVAWGGPIVMNTKEELRTAFDEYNNGTFIK